MTELKSNGDSGKRLIAVEDWECLIYPKTKPISEYGEFNLIYRDYQGEKKEFHLTAGGQDTGVVIEKDRSHTPALILKRIYLVLEIFKKLEELEKI